ncbi:hypothetical protein SBD_3258 [Streptomyces bottropensis ATCC 25435]|uniref:Uncharacterized protein n=1 Tax=Streptomyces bottropensis ATCC 25435 TaxID=1054862 RepID=M3FSI9_9ACTN|nr:hypothetical protein SBD_3258 [Streptomyces bottropensis ATCC 25435]
MPVIADDVTWLDKADAAVVGFVVRRVTDAPMSSTTLPDAAAAGKLPVGSRRDAHHDPVTGAGRLLGGRGAGSPAELGHRLRQGLGTVPQRALFARRRRIKKRRPASCARSGWRRSPTIRPSAC